MQIVFGMHLDGLVCPEIYNSSTHSINSSILGPQGFLSLLEQQLGLGYPASTQPERVAQYLAKLAEFDNESQFYSSSFGTDCWATAHRVLEMRDALVAHGVSAAHQFPPGSRLDALLKIEATRFDASVSWTGRSRKRSCRRADACTVHRDSRGTASHSRPRSWRLSRQARSSTSSDRGKPGKARWLSTRVPIAEYVTMDSDKIRNA